MLVLLTYTLTVSATHGANAKKNARLVWLSVGIRDWDTNPHTSPDSISSRLRLCISFVVYLMLHALLDLLST